MGHRLVLGCGGLGQRIVRRLIDGSGELRAVVDSEEESTWLSERNVAVTRGNPADDAVLSEIQPVPESVLVAAATPERTRSIAAAAADVFGRASVNVVVPCDGRRGVLEGLPDGVVPIDPGEVLSDHLLDLVAGESGNRVQRFRRVVRSIDGRLAVVMHDNPDPDAIASAVAVSELASAVGVEAVPCYFGDISHQENRALVNLLELELTTLDPETGVDEFEGLALVDHSLPGVNDQLPESTPVDVVIDHHPPNGPVTGDFIDLRVEVGATSTILVEYFSRLGVDLDEAVATALLYGIRVDTDDFTRELSPIDFEAAATLCEAADMSVLERVESPNVSGDTFDTVARAITNREVRDSVLTSCVGGVSSRDTLAQAADQLLQLDGVEITFVFGIQDGTVYASARASNDQVDLGATLRRAFDQIGSAGGHARMAGAQIPIGMLAESEDTDALEEVVRAVVSDRFYDELGLSSRVSDHPYTGAGAELSFLAVPELSADDASRNGAEELSADDASRNGAGELSADDAGRNGADGPSDGDPTGDQSETDDDSASGSGGDGDDSSADR